MVAIITNELVYALIGSDITAAGLVFAIYTFILPKTRRILEERVKNLQISATKLGRLSKSTRKNANLEDADVEEMENAISEIKEKQELPFWLSSTILGSFVLFCADIFACFNYLSNPIDGNASMAIWAFLLAVLLFTISGFNTLKISLDFMKEDYQKLLSNSK